MAKSLSVRWQTSDGNLFLLFSTSAPTAKLTNFYQHTKSECMRVAIKQLLSDRWMDLKEIGVHLNWWSSGNHWETDGTGSALRAATSTLLIPLHDSANYSVGLSDVIRPPESELSKDLFRTVQHHLWCISLVDRGGRLILFSPLSLLSAPSLILLQRDSYLCK